MGSLPLYQHTWHKTKLKSNGKIYNVRPFTMSESKNLILKKDEKDGKTFYEEIANIIKACVREDDFDPYKLYPPDFESIFYDIRSFSDSGIVTLDYPYTDDNGIERKAEIVVDLKADIELSSKVFEFKIEVPENKMIINFKMPNMKQIIDLENMSNNNKFEIEEFKVFYLIAMCLSSVMKEEQTNNSFSVEDALEFLDSLPTDYLEKITKYFDDMPSLICTKEFQLDGKIEKIKLSKEDMQSFFQ